MGALSSIFLSERLVGVGLSFSGCSNKPWLKFRICAETCRSKSASCHTLALVCTVRFARSVHSWPGRRSAVLGPNEELNPVAEQWKKLTCDYFISLCLDKTSLHASDGIMSI